MASSWSFLLTVHLIGLAPGSETAVTNGTTRETVNLRELLDKNGGYRLMAELGAQPRVYYLPPKNRLFKFEQGPDTEYIQTTS